MVVIQFTIAEICPNETEHWTANSEAHIPNEEPSINFQFFHFWQIARRLCYWPLQQKYISKIAPQPCLSTPVYYKHTEPIYFHWLLSVITQSPHECNTTLTLVFKWLCVGCNWNESLRWGKINIAAVIQANVFLKWRIVCTVAGLQIHRNESKKKEKTKSWDEAAWHGGVELKSQGHASDMFNNFRHPEIWGL